MRALNDRQATIWRLGSALWGFVLVVALAACAAGPGAPTAPVGEPALLGDAEIDRAALVLPVARTAVVGEERPELGTLPTAANTLDTEAGVPARTLTALPDAAGVIAFVRHDPNQAATPWMLFVMDQASGEITYLYGGRREIDSVAVSADGDTLVASLRLQPDTSSNFQVFRATRSTGSVERITDTSFDERNVSLSADGTVVVWEGQIGDGRRAVFVREAHTVLLLAAPHAQQQPSVSGNGRFIGLVRVLPSGNQRLLRYDRSDNTYLDLSQSGSRRVTLAHPSVSDDGERLAFLEVETRAGPPRRQTSQWQRVRYVDMLTKTVTNVAVAEISEVPVIAHPHLARDGDHLTYTWREQNASSLITHRISTATTQRIVSSALPISNLTPYWQLPDADAPAVLSVTIDQGDQTLVIGDTLHLTATVDAVADASAEVDWLSGDPGLATITPDGHLTALAAGTTTITATSTVDPTISATITVTIVDDDGSAMILTVDTTLSSGTTVTLPLFGTVDVTVDWGDGTSSTADAPGLLSYAYALDGEYTIRIRGTLTQYGAGNAPVPRVEAFVAVLSWGDLGLQSLAGAFRNASNLTGVPNWLPATVTSLNSTFDRATAFNGDIGGWDTSNVTDMTWTFLSAIAFDRDIGTWDTSSVTAMRRTFEGATAFDQDIGNWNTSVVTDMSGMFLDAAAFDHDIGRWDVSNVTDMRDMFGGAIAFNQDLSHWCVPHIPTQPEGFDAFATSWTAPRPIWGTCAGVPAAQVLSVTIDQGDQVLRVGDELQLTATVDTTGGASDEVDWFSGDSGIATITPDGYLTALAAGPTTITATSTFDPTISATIAVAVEDPRAMVLTIDTVPVFGRSFTLPLWGTVDVTVDWGDGQIRVVTAPGNLTHTYAEDGAYTLTITGSLTHFGNGIVNYPNAQALTGVTAWGELGLERLAGAFHGASRLKSVPATFPAGVWDAGHMFALASSFNGDITGWDVSNVTDMRFMFSGASAFDRDIGVWDVSNVTTMVGMFQQATSFDRELASWDVSRVTDMTRMFLNATRFNRDLGKWDTSAVTRLSGTFQGATAFNGDLGGWNTSSVTDMSYTFSGALAFNRDIGDWVTSNVTTMVGMFSVAQAFNQDIGRWNTGRVTTMNSMFANAARFNQNIGDWDTSNVADFIGMFFHASDFDQDISRWDIRSAWTLENMFRAATSFNQDIRAWDTSHVRIFAGLFQSATSFDQDIGDWDTGNATTMRNMFDGTTAFNQDIGRWDTSKVTWTYMMFQGATAFNQDIGGWDTGNVTNMLRMFGGATAFNQAIGGWDTSKVRDMEGMFERAWSFNQDIGGWDTSSAEKMTSMFDDAKAFDQDIGNWNTARVWTMQTMFRDATSFNRDLSRWCVEKITSIPPLFAAGADAWVLPRPVWGTCPE